MKTIEEKAKAYDEAIERAKITLDCCNSASIATKNTVYDIFPQLKESEDEKVRKQIRELLLDTLTDELRRLDIDLKKAFDWLEKQSQENMIEALRLEYEKGKADALQEQRKEWTSEDLLNRNEITDILQEYNRDDLIAWLEKQKNTIPDECVFRPVAGCDIESAAKQAIKQQGILAKEVVLAFNGAYIPVKGKAQDIIVNEYNSWLEKQGESDPYNGVSFEYNGHTWGMCARDNGVEIWLDEKLLKHLESNGEDWNEEDERIRKELISFVNNDGWKFTKLTKEEKEFWIAWLEKQRYSEFELENEYWRGYDDAKFHLKEDKVTVIGAGSNSASVSDGDTSVTNKEVVSHYTAIDSDGGKCTTASATFKPKFKVGDFIVNDYCMGRVVELTNDAYLLDTEQGIPFSYEHNVHRWTIQDAKDGDIIYIKRYKTNDEWLLIFKEIERQNNFIDVYDYYAFSITTNNTYHQGFCGLWGLLLDDEIVCPATKEQCNMLFAKMKEEGYEWDAEKKELKLLTTNGGDFCQEHCKGFQETGKCFADGECDAKIDAEKKELQKIKKEHPLLSDFFNSEYERGKADAIKEMKSVWNDEDERILTNLIDYFNIDDALLYQTEQVINWLKSLKERLKGE